MTHEPRVCCYFLMKFALSLLSNHALGNVNEEQLINFFFQTQVYWFFWNYFEFTENWREILVNLDEDLKKTLSLKRLNGRERNKLEIASRALYIAAPIDARKKFVSFFRSLKSFDFKLSFWDFIAVRSRQRL